MRYFGHLWHEPDEFGGFSFYGFSRLIESSSLLRKAHIVGVNNKIYLYFSPGKLICKSINSTHIFSLVLGDVEMFN